MGRSPLVSLDRHHASVVLHSYYVESRRKTQSPSFGPSVPCRSSCFFLFLSSQLLVFFFPLLSWTRQEERPGPKQTERLTGSWLSDHPMTRNPAEMTCPLSLSLSFPFPTEKQLPARGYPTPSLCLYFVHCTLYSSAFLVITLLFPLSNSSPFASRVCASDRC
ncbi:hypothetical protein BO70DRAFT_106503 [Aspergillus heteromorphus CBS 117.55]|uniref:Transmembrane protein n=1 Tax=Aspergillus heteromorphus CBS 117.55 TaxID=1448321 RepID=A0A317VKK1_9EURO|nr:uncharacterized protein BO70DRAFT_106503 [Aspergillus heteromorphus CBS 117.55]PWY74425.1 hypothetical protein BO70DRAFT_106503 [Aspergillus heteromorphus CBS 117.55]